MENKCDKESLLNKLRLVDNGIFPIKYDKEGKFINTELDTELNFPGTIQGEGKLLGIPCLFIRTSVCNLLCCWETMRGSIVFCDTPYASIHPEKNIMTIEDIVATVKNNIGDNIKHVVITGGEPLMYPTTINNLARELKSLGLHITIETNGTLFNDTCVENIDLISISPKLTTSIPTRKKLDQTDVAFNDIILNRHTQSHYKPEVLQKLIDSCYHISKDGVYTKKEDKDFQLKFVIERVSDIYEIQERYIKVLKGFEPTDIQLMPLGYTAEELEHSTKVCVEYCIKNGWRFTPRLHIDIFKDKRGV